MPTGTAFASQPTPGALGMQAAATTVMDDIRWFNDFTLIIVSAITLFVAGLLLYCIFRYNRRTNKSPKRFSHNTLLEVVWTVVPVLILVVLAVPSFRLLYKELDIPEYDLTVKATGHSWYWSYEYPQQGLEEIALDSSMLEDEDREALKQEKGLSDEQLPRLLATDYNLVVPVDTTVRVQVTASDVIHSFAVPSFGIKVDAVPGRLNETWFHARETGMYYGQCSELCGSRHAYMPIAVQVVSKEQFAAWSQAAINDVDEANDLLASMIAHKSTNTAPTQQVTNENLAIATAQ
nr:cytochrome c oxidase subunit II [Pseudovibrio stylochi]